MNLAKDKKKGEKGKAKPPKKATKEKPLNVEMSFGEFMQRIVRVKPKKLSGLSNT